jgi:hypothetical protein
VPALPAVQYLVDAAATNAPPAPPRRNYDERMAVIIGLFERQASQGRALR